MSIPESKMWQYAHDKPWFDEPNQWEERTEDGDVWMVVVRHIAWGHLCGYIDVPPGHPWHGVHYDEMPGDLVEASMGGLTYSKGPWKAAEPRPDHWRIGFDCNHLWDLSPKDVMEGGAICAIKGNSEAVYRTFTDVRDAVRKMAALAIAEGSAA